MDVITFPNICKQLVVYRFYCIALFHTQTLRHLINRGNSFFGMNMTFVSSSEAKNVDFMRGE